MSIDQKDPSNFRFLPHYCSLRSKSRASASILASIRTKAVSKDHQSKPRWETLQRDYKNAIGPFHILRRKSAFHRQNLSSHGFIVTRFIVLRC
jgi:hypothetical protein